MILETLQTIRSDIAENSLAVQYNQVRASSEKLCEPLEIEDYLLQPVAFVSPVKWNIAHTTWFFEEMILKQFASDYRVFDENFSFLFNSYYNTIGKRVNRDQRSTLSRPTVKRVFEYRRYVDEKMREFFQNDLSANATDLIILGLNHEQQHQELFLTDLKFSFGINPLFPVYKNDFALCEIAEKYSTEFVEIESGNYQLGYNGNTFCFDNELGQHNVYLNDFSIASSLVTNAEYLEFIEAGGYRDFRFWHSDGWDWLVQNQLDTPLYWHKIDGQWFQFTLSGLRELKQDAPVCHVSFYEAAAFAEWKGLRLPTEFEWEATNQYFNWGLRWEWTNSAYLPYPNFQKSSGAVGEYNGKFMVNQMILRGASVATPKGHSRPSYRNFFQPNLNWQFTGIRLAK